MPSWGAAVAAIIEWKRSGSLEPAGWVRASCPERRVCKDCGTIFLDGKACEGCFENPVNMERR